MYSVISEGKGFFKLEKEKIKYIVSAKRFAQMQKDELIKGNKPAFVKPKAPARITEDLTPSTEPAKTAPEDLTFLKKDDLIEIAKRLGFEGEVAIATTKASLIEFINSKQL